MTRRFLVASLSVVVLSAVLTACGGTAKGGAPAKSAGAQPYHVPTIVEHVLTVSADLGPIDGDDYPVINFGHAATPAELKSITAIVKRYYRVAAAENGAEGCRMLYSVVAESLVEEDGHLPGLHGKTCAVVLSKLFKRRHQEIVTNLRSFRIVLVRTERINGWVLMRFYMTVEPRKLAIRLVGGSWKIQQPFEGPMP